jgi:hypothetical protein
MASSETLARLHEEAVGVAKNIHCCVSSSSGTESLQAGWILDNCASCMSVQVSWQKESERTRRYHRKNSSVDRRHASLQQRGTDGSSIGFASVLRGFLILFGEALWRLDKGTCYRYLLFSGRFLEFMDKRYGTSGTQQLVSTL